MIIKKKMQIPFEEEPLEKLKERFPRALERIWIAYEKMEDRPGLHRDHVFDFESGLRLLISKDIIGYSKPLIHVSASWETNSPLSFGSISIQVARAYKNLGGKGNLKFLGVSNFGIPHWVVED